MTFNASKLSNGLTVVSYNMPAIKTIAINVIVRVGSRYETLEESGISHFLEHMAFKGTTTRSALDIAKQFDSIGGCFNAYTSREQTVYFAKVLQENFEEALNILADILQNSIFTKEDIQKEYQVILEEIAQVQDDPDDLVYEKFYEIAFQNHELGRSILGTKDSISTINTENLQNYLAKHYSSENIFVSIAGGIDHQRAVEASEKLFTNLKQSKKQDFNSAVYTGGESILIKDLEQSTLVLGFKSLPYTDLIPYYRAQALSIILGGGISSRLFQQIRENLGLAYSVGAYNNSYYDSGVFSLYASTSHDKLKKLQESLIGEIKKVTDSITSEELTRAKAQVKAGLYMAEEKSSYKSEEIGKNFAIFGRYYPVEKTIEDINAITAGEIMEIASLIFASVPSLSIVGGKTDMLEYSTICEKLK